VTKGIASLLMYLAVMAHPAAAANTSTYVKYDLKTCQVTAPAAEDQGASATYLCDGYAGNKIQFAEGDLRAFLGFGRDPKNHCASATTFPAFNEVLTTTEWRLERSQPIAVIQRWRVSYGWAEKAQTRSWLVVTKLEADNSCWMAMVEGALPHANEKARALADSMARGFSCKTGEVNVLARATTDVHDIFSGRSCPH
jgi:hypothetical protein